MPALSLSSALAQLPANGLLQRCYHLCGTAAHSPLTFPRSPPLTLPMVLAALLAVFLHKLREVDEDPTPMLYLPSRAQHGYVPLGTRRGGHGKQEGERGD